MRVTAAEVERHPFTIKISTIFIFLFLFPPSPDYILFACVSGIRTEYSPSAETE
jgi:hypothetical protein